jgi:hypothetical protein
MKHLSHGLMALARHRLTIRSIARQIRRKRQGTIIARRSPGDSLFMAGGSDFIALFVYTSATGIYPKNRL